MTSTSTISKFVNSEEVNRAYNLLSPSMGGKEEDYFAVVYISKKFNLPLREAARHVAFGGTDAGIDAYYLDKDKKALSLFVFRWSEDYMSFKDPLDKLGKDGIYKIFVDITRSPNDNPVLLSLKTTLFQNRKIIDHVLIDFVFNGDPVDAEQSKVLAFLRETIEDKQAIIQSYLSRVGEPELLHDLTFQYVSNQISLGNVATSKKSMEYIINFEGSLTVSSSSHDAEDRDVSAVDANATKDQDSKNNNNQSSQMTVLFLPLYSLYQMFDEMGERFFEKNLRSGLDEGKMTNIQIKDSLKRIVDGNDNHSNFTLYHNGVTLYSQILEFQNSNTLRMVEPRVLNGAQTVKILKQFIDEERQKESKTEGIVANSASLDSNGNSITSNSENEGVASPEDTSFTPASSLPLVPMPQQLKNKLTRIKVLARIIQSQNEGFLKKVTVNNNRQNPIMPWNLRANDLIQIGLEELFGKLSIYYERRENAYKNLIEEDMFLDSGTDLEKGMIEVRKFAQTLLAMQGNIDRISEIKEVFENEAWYSDTFKEHYLQTDPRTFVLLYKIQFRLQSIIREIRGVGAEKYGYVSKAKNLLWCLSIQGLLNDSKFDKLVESYGSSTNVEVALTEYLKNMATTKLRFILSDTFEDAKYKDALAQGRFSFFKTKRTLADCMNAAEKRFNWQRKEL